MSDEQQGIVILFPENFPDWALTPEERRAAMRVVEDERDEDAGGESVELA